MVLEPSVLGFLASAESNVGQVMKGASREPHPADPLPRFTVHVEVTLYKGSSLGQTGTTAAEEHARQAGGKVNLAPLADQATEQSVIGPRDPRLSTVDLQARRANVVVNTHLVAAGAPLQQAKTDAEKITRDALKVIDFG